MYKPEVLEHLAEWLQVTWEHEEEHAAQMRSTLHRYRPGGGTRESLFENLVGQ